ncbi:Wzz/FepE/Etk N-terminal domain-containing protein [Nocardia brasiliensis]|uniref:Wzz/FepE/Etk N-terminal domain-containing protein n=1 Tax=Nocardia brasiliensis TaxID=37326 RepID=UPI002456040F|nr:Wzz/FepE/Etk N-terminal domain-containing protein [Nocardia brasiliensis]
MGLIEYGRVLRRRWIVVAAAVLVCLLAAAGYAQTIPVTYKASSSMYVSMSTGTSVNDSYQGGLAAQQRVRSYLDLLTSATVAQRVIDDRGLRSSVGELRSRISASSPPATAVLVATVTAPAAAEARDLADAVVAQFRRLVDELETTELGAAPATRVAVVDRAELPAAPSGPRRTRLLALGLCAGLALGFAAALLRDRLDRRLRTSTELESVLAEPVRVGGGGAPERPAVPILAILDIGLPGEVGETRRLRARLTDAAAGKSPKMIVLTSLSGRSAPDIAARLARSLAATGARVVLVDADTTGAGSSGQLLAHTGPGLAEVLRGGPRLSDAVVRLPDDGIDLLPLGSPDPGTPDALSTERFGALLADLRCDFDHVVVEVAPVTAAADALSIAPRGDATIGVVELGTTDAAQLRGALATFGAAGAALVGVIAVSRPGDRPRLSQRLRL